MGAIKAKIETEYETENKKNTWFQRSRAYFPAVFLAVAGIFLLAAIAYLDRYGRTIFVEQALRQWQQTSDADVRLIRDRYSLSAQLKCRIESFRQSWQTLLETTSEFVALNETNFAQAWRLSLLKDVKLDAVYIYSRQTDPQAPWQVFFPPGLGRPGAALMQGRILKALIHERIAADAKLHSSEQPKQKVFHDSAYKLPPETALDNMVIGQLGEYLRFSTLRRRPGWAIPAKHRLPGRLEREPAYLAWTTIRCRGEIRGGVLLFWRRSVLEKTETALQSLVENWRKIMPGNSRCLPSFIHHQTRVTSGKSVVHPHVLRYPWLKQEIDRLARSPDQNRTGAIWQKNGWFFRQELLAQDQPYLMVLAQPMPVDSSRTQTSTIFLSALVICPLLLLFVRAWIFVQPPGISLRIMVLSLFLLLGGLPVLGILAYSRQQTTAKEAGIRTDTRNYLEKRLEEIDQSQAFILRWIQTECQRALWSWYDLARLNSSKKVALELLGKKLTALGITPQTLLLLGMDASQALSVGEEVDLTGFLTNYNQNFAQATLVAYEDTHSRHIPEMMTSVFTKAFESFLSQLGEQTERGYVNSARGGRLAAKIDGQPGRQISEVVTNQAKAETVLTLLIDHEQELWRFWDSWFPEIAWNSLRQDALEIALVQEEPDDLRPRFPVAKPNAQDNFWLSTRGQKLLKHLNIVRSNRRIHFVEEGTSLFAFLPSEFFMSGWLCGVLDIKPIVQAAQKKELRFQYFLAFLLLVIVLLASATLRELVEPLTIMTNAMDTVARGNLDIVTACPGDDDFARMTRAMGAMIDGLRERKKLSLFVSGSFSFAATSAQHRLKQRGIVLVSDIRNFTTLVEVQPPETITAMLNCHLAQMACTIQAMGGLLDKFVGDAVIAIFWCHDSELNAVHRALQAGCRMLEEHRHLNAERRQQGLFTYEIGVGLALGELVIVQVENAGDRSDFQILGPALAEAEAMEQLSKEARAFPLIVSSPIAQMVRDTTGYAFTPLPYRAAYELCQPQSESQSEPQPESQSEPQPESQSEPKVVQ